MYDALRQYGTDDTTRILRRVTKTLSAPRQARAAPPVSCPSVEGLLCVSGGAIRPPAVTRQDLENATVIGQVHTLTPVMPLHASAKDPAARSAARLVMCHCHMSAAVSHMHDVHLMSRTWC